MLIKRILLLFFRDKANVFFSLLAVFIIIGLYVLFLGNIMEQDLHAVLGFASDKIGLVAASLMLAGMVAVVSVTSCLGALSISIADKQNAAKDFLTSPVSRGKITFSYMLGSGVVGLTMTVFALVLCLAYIAAKGGALPGALDCAYLFLTAILSVLCGNSLVFFICFFLKSQNAFTALSTIIGTLIGFLMGIYIPIGSFPNAVQWVIKCFPMTHAASMFRQILADGELAALFANAPAEALEGLREAFGVVLTYGNVTSSFWLSAAILAATTAVFYSFSLIAMRIEKR
jgi:multidrug/hemolysin transport system permease protein